MINKTHYHFLPAIRQGLARLIKDESADNKRAQLDVDIFLKARNQDSGTYESSDDGIKVPVQLYGPGDVLGFSPQSVIRTEPKIGTSDFEPNYFPFIEFKDSDLLWRYSAEPVKMLDDDNDVKYIEPWLVLVVLESGIRNDHDEFTDGDTEFFKIRQNTQGLPDLIQVKTTALPDLTHNWRWAHVQISGEENMDNTQIISVLENASDMATCRLMSPRRLKPNQKYSCFILPSTQIGRYTGIAKAELEDKSAYKPAWTNSEETIEIPYYFNWEFTTGERGDFEYLVRLLEPRKLHDIGTQQIDCSKPGYSFKAIERSVKTEKRDKHILDMEGALQSPDTRYTPWGMDPYIDVEVANGIFDITLTMGIKEKQFIISWRTSLSCRSKINYGRTALVNTVELNRHTQNHTLILDDIGIEREYQFQIEFSSSEGRRKLNGKFIIPQKPDFQKKLANLINRPVSEDLDLKHFEILMNEYEWLSDFHAKLLPSGSDVEIRYYTPFFSSLEIVYGELNQDDHILSPIRGTVFVKDHMERLSSLLPGKTYQIKLIVQNQQGDIFITDESNFSMPALPTIVPPVYGRWHYGKYRKKEGKDILVDPSAKKEEWVDQLNLDPRHRAAASLGTQVIRKNQEELMASAWDQLGAVESVNDLLRRKQFARESSKNILQRIDKLSVDRFIIFSTPLQSKITMSKNENKEKITIQHHFADETFVPKAVMNQSFQKLQTHVTKKISKSFPANKTTIVEKLLKNEFSVKHDNVKPNGTMIMEEITNGLLLQSTLTTFSAVFSVSNGITLKSDFLTGIKNEKDLSNASNKAFDSIDGLKEKKENSLIIGKTIEGWLNADTDATNKIADKDPKESLKILKTHILQSLNPEITFLENAKYLLRVEGALRSNTPKDELEPIMAAPEFPQPMNESLLELSKSLFLPGIEKLKPNTIGLLETNPRFIEAFMCGLNHEFGSELLFRGYPTDQRETYFRQFWDKSYSLPTREKRKNLINQWLSDHNINSIEELSKVDKEIIIYKHSRLFIMELKKIYQILQLTSKIYEKNIRGNHKQKILHEISRIIKGVSNNDSNTFKNVSDEIFDILNPFIKKMVEKDCIKESKMDIKPMHLWENKLGSNTVEVDDKLVLVIRGDLLKRYPNAIIYAVDGYKPGDSSSELIIPAMDENIKDLYGGSVSDDLVSGILEEHPKIYPVFESRVDPDIVLIGFPFNRESTKKSRSNFGKFFVIEEHISESRFGLDTVPENEEIPSIGNPANWDNLSWDHFGIDVGDYVDSVEAGDRPQTLTDNKWKQWVNASSAKRARMTLQKPVRIIIDADELLPK